MDLRRISFALIAVFFGVACSGKSKPPETVAPPPAPGSAAAPAPAPPPTVPEGPPVQKVSLGEVGLEAASLDRTADPCVDFFQYACGGWLKTTEIPADKARWGRFNEIDEHNKVVIKQLLDDDAKGAGRRELEEARRLLQLVHGRGRDREGRNQGIQPLLDKAMKVKDNASWFAALGELHKAGVDVMWGTGAEADFKDSNDGVTGIDSGGLGLPDRDYYLEEKFKIEARRVHRARRPHARARQAAGRRRCRCRRDRDRARDA